MTVLADLVARRGASAYEQPNSAEAIKLAIQMGASHVWLDLRRTKDRKLVVSSDSILDNGKFFISLDSNQIDEDLLMLDDALTLCKSISVHLVIHNDPSDPDYDPECADAEILTTWLMKHQAPQVQLICSADEDSLKFVHQHHNIATARILLAIDDEELDAVKSAGHSAIFGWGEMLEHDIIEKCHENGVKIYVWPTNDRNQIRKFIDWGVDGLVTDMPDVATNVIAEHKIV